LGTEATHVSGTWWRHVPAGGDVLHRPADPPDLRWQHGDVVEGLYFADSPETAWAEWYRWLAEAGIPPTQALPRDLWRWDVALPRVADLSSPERLEEHGLGMPSPGQRDWPTFQTVGDELYGDGWPGLLAPSAARPDGLILCVFREVRRPPGVEPVPPPERFDRPPTPPTGMRT
jgi:RES domain-containing protein